MRLSLQHKSDQRAEQLLLDNHRHHGEKHRQQRGEGQRFGKGLANGVLVRDAAQRGGEHDHRQANQADLRQMQRQRDDKPQTNSRLNPQFQPILARALRLLLAIALQQNDAYRVRQRGAVAEQAKALDQQAGENAAQQHRHRNRRHTQKEAGEIPAGRMSDNQVLRFAYHGHHAAQRGTDASLHHQAAQKGAKLLQRGALIGIRCGVVGVGRDAMVDLIEADGDADDDGDHRQGVKKGGKKRGRQAEGEAEQHLRPQRQQQPREDEQQQLFHEKDAGDHKDQQQQHFKVIRQLLLNLLGAGHADGDRFQRQQAAGQQRVAFQRHAERKDKFGNQQPAGKKRADEKEQ